MINTQQLVAKLQPYLNGQPLWLAFSGGLDSTVLTHLLANSFDDLPLRLVHVNHQLNPNSGQWANQCQQFADTLGLPITTLTVNVDLSSGASLEAAARQARYDAIARHIGDDGILVTGQHLQDQAETLMLQLLRGAGNRGLSAMSFASKWHKMTILRPLLQIEQSELVAYATHHQLPYVDDPSNDDDSIQRNFLRHKIWPLLKTRWPAVNQLLSRSADHLREAQSLLDEMAESDLKLISANFVEKTLSCSALLALSPARQRNVLRYFLHLTTSPLPTTVILQKIIDEVCAAKLDAQPLVQWSGNEARRFGDKLYVQKSLPEVPPDWFTNINKPSSVGLPDGRYLDWKKVSSGIKQGCFDAGLTVRFRQGGEKIQLAGHLHRHDLKNCLQQWQIPPWQRVRLPLLFAGEELLAVADHAISAKALTAEGEQGWWPFVRDAD
ncbi:tRNA lysidine(34) synthetase TilS [Methylophaga sp. OBS3]|uniref:tRNA lysidine(34) synthetase TilS n=1 Tax=Methylophaga sp. OBS3 TaxID=2991934 RepID=UPI00224F9001|nr:tRNA lysidine(34) synthetase TilS [Methylophaga sp. OBS3]MCX4189136.1 tRNA lysidine(34) synthetase TilS [Methylophaga sp. OBS3]